VNRNVTSLSFLAFKGLTDPDRMNTVLAANKFLQFNKGILDLQRHTAAPAPGVEVELGSSPQCPLAHESPGL
jgi:hypothetical protein